MGRWSSSPGGCGLFLVASLPQNDGSVQSVGFIPISSFNLLGIAWAHSSTSYVQMSAMVLGGMIEADQSLRRYEAQVRAQRRWLREKAKWDRYEQEVAQNSGK